MYDRFKDLGVPVAITRTTDETLSRAERLGTMTNSFGNDLKVIVLSNHINAGGVMHCHYTNKKYNPLQDKIIV